MKEIINYLIFGGLTTVINVISFSGLEFLSIGYKTSTIIAWVLSVLFAYITNKRYVFKTKTSSTKETFKEASTFFTARIASLLIDLISMMLLVEILKIDSMVAKILANIVVIIVNYILSKAFIFNKK